MLIQHDIQIDLLLEKNTPLLLCHRQHALSPDVEDEEVLGVASRGTRLQIKSGSCWKDEQLWRDRSQIRSPFEVQIGLFRVFAQCDGMSIFTMASCLICEKSDP